jgi:preprotein translocase subunit SecD
MWGNHRFRLVVIALIALVCLASIIIFKFNLGLDLQGGMRLVLQAREVPNVKFTPDLLDGSLEVIRTRIDALGVSEPLIQRKGEKQLIVELPGIREPERAIKLVGDSAILEFAAGEYASAEIAQLATADIKALYGENAKRIAEARYDSQGHVIGSNPLIIREVFLTGKYLKYAGPSTDEYGRPAISIEFGTEGAKKMFDFTNSNIGKPMIIMLDGRVISAPRVNGAISDKGQITGGFSVKEMQDFIIKLKAGSLPVPLDLVENRQVGPTLGKDSIAKSILAGLIGFAFVAIFMVSYYKFPGVVSIVALILFMLINLAILSLLKATLTLVGIAGLLLAMGMAVDTNVIIFERLKEELRFGHDIKKAMDIAFQRAMTSIIDSHVTTIIGTSVLFFLGTGTVKGFAITLMVGILSSLFTAIVLTHWILDYCAEFKFMQAKKWIRF